METHAGGISSNSHPCSRQENDAAEELSRPDMDDSHYDEKQYEEANPPQTYQDELNVRIQMMFLLASERKLQPSSKFPLALNLIQYHQ